MGIAGAAWATVIGQVVSGIMVILYLRKFKTVKLTKEKLRPHSHYIGRIVSLGMAPFFNQVSMMVVQIVMNNVLMGMAQNLLTEAIFHWHVPESLRRSI